MQLRHDSSQNVAGYIPGNIHALSVNQQKLSGVSFGIQVQQPGPRPFASSAFARTHTAHDYLKFSRPPIQDSTMMAQPEVQDPQLLQRPREFIEQSKPTPNKVCQRISPDGCSSQKGSNEEVSTSVSLLVHTGSPAAVKDAARVEPQFPENYLDRTSQHPGSEAQRVREQQVTFTSLAPANELHNSAANGGLAHQDGLVPV
jgi:hypothetical protein